MKVRRKFWLSLLAGSVAVVAASSQAPAQHDPKKTNKRLLSRQLHSMTATAIYGKGWFACCSFPTFHTDTNPLHSWCLISPQ